jgi:uncharacterized membrane protein YhaH (DUF805 family)
MNIFAVMRPSVPQAVLLAYFAPAARRRAMRGAQSRFPTLQGGTSMRSGVRLVWGTDGMDLNAIIENFRNTVTQHYFDMNGRVGRERFWYFVLACVVAEVVASILQVATFLPIGALASLALLLPSAGMGARRLQDTGRNGNLVWIFIVPALITQLFALLAFSMFGFAGAFAFYLTLGRLLGLIELIAAIVLIYYWCQLGDPQPNAYGAPPA